MYCAPTKIRDDNPELNSKSQKHAISVRETLETLLSESIETLDTADMEKRCKALVVHSRLSHKSADVQRVLVPAWEPLCQVFARLWAAKEKGEFSLDPGPAPLPPADPNKSISDAPKPEADAPIQPQPIGTSGRTHIVHVFRSVLTWLWNTTDALESMCAQALQQGLVAMFATDLSSALFVSHMNHVADKDAVSYCMRGYMGVVFNTVRRRNINLPLITAARDRGFVGILKQYTKSKCVCCAVLKQN